MIAIKKHDMNHNSIIIVNEQDKKPVMDEHIKLLENTACTCLGLEPMETGCEISITLVDNERICELNRDYRQVNAPTDVLSFPVVNMQEGRIICEDGDYDMDEGLLLLGDIVISMEKVESQAYEYGHSIERELAFLASHGVFHLLGYDHENDEQERMMLDRQEKVLVTLGLGRV